MTKQVQLRRGTTAEHQVFTGAEGELTIDTTRDIAIVHDGVTAGGHELVGVAATGQTIVNKDGVGIGTSVASSPLTVVGNAEITGDVTLGSDVDITSDLTAGGNLNISGISTFAALGSNKVEIGVGDTDLVVTGDARITGILTVGTASITIDGINNRIIAPKGVFGSVEISGDNLLLNSFEVNVVDPGVSVGATIVPVDSVSGVQTGYFFTAGSINKAEIIGVGTTSVSDYYAIRLNTTASKEVSVGSTIIPITSIAGIDTSRSDYFISASTTIGEGEFVGIFDVAPIVGFTTDSLPATYNTFSDTFITTSISAGSTIFYVGGLSGATTSDFLTIPGLISLAPITGSGNAALTPYYLNTKTTAISTAVSAGSTSIPVSSTTGIAQTNYLTIDGIFDKVAITGFGTVAAPPSYTNLVNTTLAQNVGAGDTVIYLTTVEGILPIAGDTVQGLYVPGLFESARIVAFSTAMPNPYVEIDAGDTSASTATSGTEALVRLETPSTYATVLIGAGDTSGSSISVGTSVTTEALISPFSDYVTIGAGDTVNTSVSFGTSAYLQRYTTNSTPAVLIGAGSTYPSIIASGVGVTISQTSGVRDTIIIAQSGIGTIEVSAGTTATITEELTQVSDLVVNNINSVGIATLAELELAGMRFPTADGLKGQVLLTDGLGNIGFGTGTGGGSEVILKVSSGIGSDDNDGIILPLRTIKKATQLASRIDRPTTIQVETGEYVEDNPILVYDSVSIIGDSLRNIVVRPQNAGKDLFKVRNGCYITGMAFNDLVDVNGVPQHTYNYAIAFDDPYDTNVDRTGYAATTTVNVINATYDNVSGFTTITTDEAHELRKEYSVKLSGIGWTCGYDEIGISTFVYDHVSGVSTITFLNNNLIGEIGSGNTQKGYKIGDKVFLHNLPFSCTSVGSTFNVTNLIYDETAGIATITLDVNHGFSSGDYVRLANIELACSSEHAGVTSTIFPYVGSSTSFAFNAFDTFKLVGVSTINLNTFEINVGVSTIAHTYVSGGTATLGITSTIYPYVGLDTNYQFVYPVTGVNTSSNTITIQGGISTIPHVYEGWPTIGISTFEYDHVSGIATATTTVAHGLSANDSITLAGLEFSCAVEHAGVTTTIFPDGTVTAYSPDGYTFRVSSATTNTFTYNVGISTIAHTYETGGTVRKVPTAQEIWYYPDYHKDGQTEFGVVSVGSSTEFTIRGQLTPIPHYYVQGGTANLSRPIINKSPYIQNCSILSSLGGNGILVDGDKVATVNKGIIPELGEIPVVGDQPEFGKSMVAATFTMISFGGIGWRTINDGYAQVVSCFQIFCRYGSLCQSGGYLSITNSATNFGDKALRSTGFSRNAFAFDRGYVTGNGTQDGLQTMRIVGLGRSDQELYVLRFFDFGGVDRTSLFKPLTQFEEFTSAGVNTVTNVFNIPAHPFINGESVVYNGNEQASPPEVLSGLVNDSQYYVGYLDAANFKLYEDEGLQTEVDVYGTFAGVGTFTKNQQEFYNYEFTEVHNEYQKLTLASAGSTANFVSGRAVTQGSASGFAVTFSQTTRELLLSVEEIGGTRTYFNDTTTIADHSGTPISVGIDTVVGVTTYWTGNFKIESTVPGNLISGINSLTENYELRFHRPSIVNSSAHTWEYSGSGTDYNALPQNGGRGNPASEQVSELGGRVYASGTNELGDFKIGSQITAFNRTGNIIFNNKVTIGELASIRLSLSGGVAVEEFSTDTGLGDNEVGGPKNSRVSTQLAVKSFLTNRLGSFIDKQVSTNAIPNAVVQLNGQGQINGDLIPPQVVTFNLTNVGGGRTVLVNEIPAKNIAQGDTIVEPDDSFVLVNDVLSQYLILDDENTVHTFANDDVITSSLTETVTGIVTSPPEGIGIGTQVQPYVGYGNSGYVKGVCLSLAITNGGTGYLTAGIYTGVSLTTVTGVGQSAYATITIGAGLTATVINAFAGGRGYAVGDVVSVADALVGGRSGGAQLQATVQDVETRLYLELTGNQKFAGTVALPDYISDGNAVSISTSLTDNYSVDIDPTDFGTGGDIDFTDDRIIVGSGHQFGAGDPIVYDANGGSMISASGNGILNLNTYYTKPVGVSSVELYYDYSLVNKLNFTGSGIGTHVLRRQVVNVNKDTLVVVGHGFTVGDPFRVYGAAPTGITTHEFFYLGSVTTNAFTLHETQADALLSVNGVSFNPVGMSGTSSGITTLTQQNVRYSATVNTSSQNSNNFALLARDSIDASNIVSGIVASTRLGTGVANDFTFLNGSSEYKKVITSVGIGTTQPISVTATSSELAAGGIGVNTYYGDINIVLNRVSDVGIDDYTTLGVSKFKKSTFSIGSDGEIQIKSGSNGDVNANTLQGQGPAYYLNADNHTGSVPITRGGTGLTGVPGNGAILIGNSSAYNLTTTPTFTGTVTAPLFSGPVSNMRSFDTRAAASTPETYDAANGIHFDFKSNSTNGLSDGGNYNGTMYFRPYGASTDWSGGGAHELGFTQNGNLWHRYGSNTSWGSWYRILKGDNFNNNTNVRINSLGVGQNASGTAGECKATSFTETSSITLKENINPILSALDSILGLNPVTYDRKDGSRINESGLIAEEVAEILPSIVARDSEGNPDSIMYSRLTAYLVQAIKELKSEINDLKNNNK